MTLEIVPSDEALLAVVAAELPVTEMSLNVGLNVLLTTKALVAVVKFADPFLVGWVWSFDELCDVV